MVVPAALKIVRLKPTRKVSDHHCSKQFELDSEDQFIL